MSVDGEAAGFASIHGERLITQFAVAAPVRHYSQALFARLRETESVQTAFVPTCDEFFLSHALDKHRALSKQAYFFAARDDSIPVAQGFELRPATHDDAARIRAETADFFDPIEERIGRSELFMTLRNGAVAGIGIGEVSAIYPDVASIGVFTVEQQRGAGVGTATIAMLIAAVRARGLRPVAGCWYYNHASKRTLERAGMVTATRLLKIEF